MTAQEIEAWTKRVEDNYNEDQLLNLEKFREYGVEMFIDKMK